MSTAQHSLPETHQAAIQNTHPESDFPVASAPVAEVALPKKDCTAAPHVLVVNEKKHVPSNPHPESTIPVADISLAPMALPKIAVPPLTAAITYDEQGHTYQALYPEFQNLAAEKESDTKLAFDFGKEILNTTVIQPLKQLAHYVVKTISSWFH